MYRNICVSVCICFWMVSLGFYYIKIWEIADPLSDVDSTFQYQDASYQVSLWNCLPLLLVHVNIRHYLQKNFTSYVLALQIWTIQVDIQQRQFGLGSRSISYTIHLCQRLWWAMLLTKLCLFICHCHENMILIIIPNHSINLVYQSIICLAYDANNAYRHAFHFAGFLRDDDQLSL